MLTEIFILNKVLLFCRSEEMRKIAFFAVLTVASLAGCASRDYVLYSEAMLPTVGNGERLSTIKKKPDVGELARYDLIVIQQPTEERYTSVMRIVAFPGEKVRIQGTIVYVDGRPLDIRKDIGVTYEPMDSPNATYGIDQDYTVPPRKVFVLGDNFSRAKDSRVYGPVPEELILAKVRKSDL